MRKSVFLYLILPLFILPISAQNSKKKVYTGIIPKPVKTELMEGKFYISPSLKISVTNDSLHPIASGFQKQMMDIIAIEIEPTHNSKGDIKLTSNPKLAPESYLLKITPDQIDISASDRSGFFYAFQTLRQLLSYNENYLPALVIEDTPRFGYRGLLLDTSRSFIPKDEILKLIDCMAILKLNKLHLHLTDDNGWRVEIERYPLLTDIGSWRVDRGDTPFPARRNPEPGEPTTSGGFYTKKDIREIVDYATERCVEVIPEIDMPAHSNAALAAYPQYTCPVVEKFIGVLPGIGGDNADIIYCAGNDSVFVFLQNILDEVMEMFPSKYIHLGGDEAWKTHWDVCPLCQARIVEETLDGSEALQGWFMSKMNDYVRSKGHEVIGWDELTNSDIPEDAIIMGWQGYGNAALKAAAKGHRFIMTPARLMYFIRYQGPQWFEPLTYFAGGDLKEVYEYEPVQQNWQPEYEDLLMGVQACLWTEFANTPEAMEYQLFPRLTALSEVAWRPKGEMSWEDYLVRLDRFLPLLKASGVNYATSMFNIQQKITPADGNLMVELECIRHDVEILYTLDGTDPTTSSPRYEGPLLITPETTVLKSVTFSNGERKGQILTLPFVWNKATGKTIIDPKPDELLLVNGLKGSDKQTDLEWTTWKNCSDVEVTVDLGKEENVSEIILGFVNNFGMGVHRPEYVAISLSSDNDNYHEVGSRSFTSEEIFIEGNGRYEESFIFNEDKARYVRVNLNGPDVCPPTHTRPGKAVQVFMDEIIVN